MRVDRTANATANMISYDEILKYQYYIMLPSKLWSKLVSNFIMLPVLLFYLFVYTNNNQ